MAINTLTTATLFMTQLDKIAVQEATTGWMDANAGQVIYNGGSEVKIPKMSVQGMGDYDREAGYQRGSVTLEYETRKMTQDRGRLFQLDPMDINEANFIPTAGAVMGEFQRTQVVPEIDAYRISKLATETLTADKAGMIGESYVPGTASTSALRKLKEGIKAVRENYNGALICQATPDFIMELELELAGKITAVTFSKGGIQTQVPSVDGVPLVSTPSNRMYTAIKINNGKDKSGNILLGHSNSKNKLKITNDSIQFKGTSDTAITPDSDATAWITGKVFHINSGEIESSLKFGKVLMKPTKNGIQIGNKAEFGERVRIGYPLSSSSQYIYSDCPLVVGSNSGVEDDFPWFAVDDGYAFVKNGIATPGDFTIKFGEYTMNRPDGGRFNGTFRPYFRADDVINMEFYVIGYVTSGKQEIIFLIPFSRPIMTKPVSISSINGLTIRQNGKYIYNSTVSKPIKPASYTAAVIGGGNGLNVKAKIAIGSNGFTDTDIKNIVNNDTCAITASIKITFS